MGFSFPIKWFLLHRSGFAFVFSCFCRRLVVAGVMLSTVSFFIGFHVGMTKFDLIEYSLYQIMFVNVLQIWTLRSSRQFWIIKCVGLEPIPFAINLDPFL